MIQLIKKIFVGKKPQYLEPEEFAILKNNFESKKQELIKAIRKASEDRDILRKDILLKELSENEIKFEEIRKGLWGNIKPHPNRLSACEEATKEDKSKDN